MLTLIFTPLLAVMGWDDALIVGGIAAALGGSSAGLTSWLGNKNSKKSLKRQAALNYRYQLLMAKNGPSATVEGLRKAGLNPMLAATDGSFATPSMPSVSADAGSYSKVDMGSALDTALSIRQTDANVDLQKSQSELNDTNAKLNGIRAMNELSNGGFGNDWFKVGNRLMQSFGFDKSTAEKLVKSFRSADSANAKGVSVPNGSSVPDTVTKSRNAPNDNSSNRMADLDNEIAVDEDYLRAVESAANDIYHSTGERPRLRDLSTNVGDTLDRVDANKKLRRYLKNKYPVLFTR